MPSILHTVPVASNADSKLLRNSVLFTLETLNIQSLKACKTLNIKAVTGE